MSRHSLVYGLVIVGFALCGVQRPADGAGKKQKTTRAETKVVTRTYPVADLVVPIDTDKEPDSTFHSPLRYLYRVQPRQSAGQAVPTFHDCVHEPLIDLIRARVVPASWDGHGGRATIAFFPPGMSLHVRQTEEAHQAIQALLAELRSLLDLEVAVEVRLLRLPGRVLESIACEMALPSIPQMERRFDENGTERLGIDFEKVSNVPVSLEDRQVRRLLALAQNDRAANVMQFPRITLLSGQGRTISVVDQRKFVADVELVKEKGKIVIRPKTETVEVGCRFGLQPVVSADRRYVSLDIDFRETTVVEQEAATPLVLVNLNGEEQTVAPAVVARPKLEKLELTSRVTVPDSRTLVLPVGIRMGAETRREYGPPLAAWIPYLSRFCRHVGYGREAEAFLLLVTPRVVMAQEAEVNLGNLNRRP